MNTTTNTTNSEATESDALRTKIRAEIEKYELSQTSIAKESGTDKTGASKLNQWMKGSYPGDNRKIEQQLTQWLLSRLEQIERLQEMPTAPDWVKMPTGGKIHNTLAYAQMSGVACCIVGGAGVGKSTTCDHYQKTHNNVWVVTASPSASTYPASLKRIAKAVGVRSAASRAADLEDEIIDRLKGTRGLLIIDEAQLLSLDALWGIKHLFDATKIGIAYVGSEQVYSNLMGRKAEMNAPLFRRISKKQVLKKPVRDDVAALLNAWGLTDKASIDYCAKIADKPGALGMVTEALRMAAFLAMGKQQPLALNYIRAAYQEHLDYQA